MFIIIYIDFRYWLLIFVYMKNYSTNPIQLLFFAAVAFLFSCTSNNVDKTKKEINYPKITKLVKQDNNTSVSDTNNFFDDNEFDPTKDSLQEMLNTIEQSLLEDSAQIANSNVNDSGILSNNAAIDTLNFYADIKNALNDTFTNDLNKITNAELKSLKYNLDQLKNKTIPIVGAENKQINARLWARISKKKQLMQLYIDGKLVDSFKVSTGDKKHETPAFDINPSGPVFNKYTSKKYPGGNFNGLGNMPYVVFIQGGFAIHGTTKGNIPKLGKKASHGCVRLHPDNAKIFNNIVKAIGLENTWVTITEGE